MCKVFASSLRFFRCYCFATVTFRGCAETMRGKRSLRAVQIFLVNTISEWREFGDFQNDKVKDNDEVKDKLISDISFTLNSSKRSIYRVLFRCNKYKHGCSGGYIVAYAIYLKKVFKKLCIPSVYQIKVQRILSKI